MSSRTVTVCVVAGTLLCVSACSLLPGGKADSSIRAVQTIAVLPLRESPRGELPDGGSVLDAHAGKALTAQIYGLLAEQTRFRFVPDLSMESYLADVPSRDIEGARALAQAAQADGVLFGTVYRFRDRVGPRYAASTPASVSFDLALYSAVADEVVWRGAFDETQQPLSENVLKAWMFWRGGPHWLTSRELARLGLERLLGELQG